MPIFGSTVTSAFTDPTFNEVPAFLDRALTQLEDNGLKTEWLFYQEGDPETVESIKQGIESKGAKFSYSPSHSPHDLSTVVKNYFQDLDEPAFPFQLYSRFVTCNLKVEDMREVVNALPTPNLIIIQRLFLFFKKLSSFANVNMMTAYNISCTIANDLLRFNPPNSEDYNHIADVISFMIENAPAIFPSTQSKPKETRQETPNEELTEQEQWNKLLHEKNMLDQQARDDQVQQEELNEKKEKEDKGPKESDAAPPVPKKPPKPLPKKPAGLPPPPPGPAESSPALPAPPSPSPVSPPAPLDSLDPTPTPPSSTPDPTPDTTPIPTPTPAPPSPVSPAPLSPTLPPKPTSTPAPPPKPTSVTSPTVPPKPSSVSPVSPSPPPKPTSVAPSAPPKPASVAPSSPPPQASSHPPPQTPSQPLQTPSHPPQASSHPPSQTPVQTPSHPPSQSPQIAQAAQPAQSSPRLSMRVPPQPPTASAPAPFPATVSAPAPASATASAPAVLSTSPATPAHAAAAHMSMRVPPQPPAGVAPYPIMPAEPSNASIDPTLMPQPSRTAPYGSGYPAHGALQPQPPRPQQLRPQAPQFRASPMMQEQALAQHAQHAQTQARNSQWRYEGYLVKKGAKVRNWKTRWFRMDSSVIYYYKDRNSKTPLGNIVLAAVKNVFAIPAADTAKGYAFDVHTDVRNWSFVAYSAEEREKWIDALTRTSPALAEKVQPLQVHQILPPQQQQSTQIPQNSPPHMPQYPSNPQLSQPNTQPPPTQNSMQNPAQNLAQNSAQNPAQNPQYYELLQQQALIEQRLQQMQAQGNVPTTPTSPSMQPRKPLPAVVKPSPQS